MSKPLGFSTHDHARCIETALASAEALCATEGVRLTETRRRILELLLEHHRAMGAYDLLDHLAREGRRAQPPVAYRALEFLVRHGLAHKIESRNAYVACTQPGDPHIPAFMICRDCGHIAEAAAQSAGGSLAGAARSTGFRIESTVIEAEGLCPDCSKDAS